VRTLTEKPLLDVDVVKRAVLAEPAVARLHVYDQSSCSLGALIPDWFFLGWFAPAGG